MNSNFKWEMSKILVVIYLKYVFQAKRKSAESVDEVNNK